MKYLPFCTASRPRVELICIVTAVKKGQDIPVSGRGGPQGCETSRLPHLLDNRLTDGGEVVSLIPDRPLPPGRFLVLISVRG
jgi:hypothetical protein